MTELISEATNEPPSNTKGISTLDEETPPDSGNIGHLADKCSVPMVQWHLCRQRGGAGWRATLFDLYLDRTG